MVTLYKGQDPLTKNDLNVFILDENNNYFSPFYITYSIYKTNYNQFDLACSEELLLETLNSVPIPFGIGQFFAPWQMPKDISVGNYRIKWNVKRFDDSPIQQEIEEFQIVIKADKILQSMLSGGQPLTDFPNNQFQGGCGEAS